MIAAAKAAAEEAGVRLSLIHGKIEEFPTTQTYDVITIGRALHWLERAPDVGRA
jgi:2-polyprenyl-3-methyl-5-hydroxy-6-metoxy-1,4-benzoquinol methylase